MIDEAFFLSRGNKMKKILKVMLAGLAIILYCIGFSIVLAGSKLEDLEDSMK